MKALKVTISGSYKSEGANKETVDFAGLTKVIPFVPEDYATQQVRARYARMWIIQDEKFKKRPAASRPVVYVDGFEVVENYEFSFVGKDIRQMTSPELQDLSVAFNLTRVPLFQGADLRTMQTIAYVDYNNRVLKAEFLDEKEQGFNIMHYDPIIVKEIKEFSDEPALERLVPNKEGMMPEGVDLPKKEAISFEDLKVIAGLAGVKHNPKISHNALYEKIYGHVI